MFCNKAVCPFFISITLLCACTNNKTATVSSLADTAKINHWKKNYDSLYNNFYASREDSFINQAGIYADSIIASDNLLLDSNYRKIYLSALFNRSIDLNGLHYYIKSRELLDRYIFLYEEYKSNSPEYLAYARVTLANIYSRYGDYKKAALLIKQALAYYTSSNNTESMASCMLNLSIPLKELKRYDEATDVLYRIFQLPTLSSKRKGVACTELADIYTRQHKIPEAGIQIEKAKQFLHAAAYDPGIPETFADLYNITGDWQMANNDPQAALKSYRHSVDSAIISSGQDLRNREIGKTYIAMGKAFDQLQLTDSALWYYNRAFYTVINIDTLDKFSLPQQKDIYAENTIAEALYARADCIVGRGTENTQELENAVSCYRLAFATESKLLNAFSYDESRLYMVEETRKQTEKAIAICYRLYKKTNNLHWANEAFLFAEHNKAFVLAESVRRNTAASLFLRNDTLYNQMQDMQSSLASTEIEMGKQKFSAATDTILMQSLSAAKQKTEEELLSVENNIRIKNPQYSNRINDETEITAEALINKTVPGGTAMIEYFSGDSSLYAFSVSKNTALNFYKLPRTVKTMTGDFLHFFSNQNLILNNPVQYAAAANNLYRSILGPYLQATNKSVLIIPDGFINYIPFDALLTGPASSGNIASFPFLIKQQETYYAFSCKTLLAQTQNNNSTADNTITAFAPVFANKERGLSSLMHSNEELEAIKALYPKGKYYTGNTATLQQFIENCGNTSIIHLATHASPGNDSLPARIELYDSSIYINSIYAKKLKAKLVVLSGCETGTGLLNRSEGLMSLARGFSYAGTKNVIASLWQTEDNSSAGIFKDFYSNLSGNDFSSALHKAKLALLNNANVATASPYYWSGYIYIGSPKESLSAKTYGSLKLIAAITGLLLFAVYFLFVRRRRGKN